MKEIDSLSVATIRSSCIDAINKANSGHPGMAIGSAPILYTLFTKHLNASPDNSKWFNRDRFVLSAGHASSLLYTILHLCGYKLSIDDLKSFRQLDSKTPGHPEVGYTDGVDATSGPLGQGISQAVGMAMAEEIVRNAYKDGYKLCNHYTYCLCGDGCLQEGISQEAISLAGHLKLSKLILFYDANNVTLDGKLSDSFSEDVKGRFISSNWNVLEIDDGNDVDNIDGAIIKAKKSDKPTLIIVHTIIGFGSINQGTNKVHGNPLGLEDGHNTKLSYGFDHEDFYVPNEVYDYFKNTFIRRGNKLLDLYNQDLEEYKKINPSEYDKFISSFDIMNNVESACKSYVFSNKDSLSTRSASGKILNHLMNNLTSLYGGSADVAGSVMTKLEGKESFDAFNRNGHNINWGIREFAMASAQNGILLHGGLNTYVGCFFVFADYMKPAIRMAALSKLPAIYLFSHDSIGVGEDGPTHQPIEQLSMLRSIPNVSVIRPCDEKETLGAWKQALLSRNTPTALVLSRQNLPLLENSDVNLVSKGAYVVSKEQKKNSWILLATGSEVSLAINLQKELIKDGIDVRVVSMPSWDLFEKQDEKYKTEVLNLPRENIISIEMLSTFGWDKYAKFHLGIDSFGASAPANLLLGKFNFTKESLIKKINSIIR